MARLEGRQQGMDRMEDLSEGNQSQEEEPHKDSLNSQEDNGPRRSRGEMDDQASARGRELWSRAFRGSLEEDGASAAQRDRRPGPSTTHSPEESIFGGNGGHPPCIMHPGLAATTGASSR